MLTPNKSLQASRQGAARARPIATWLRENALSLATISLFLGSWLGQVIFGYRAHNEELIKQAQPALTISAYLSSGHFIEALFENWESEFLQMAVFVWLSAQLRQKGSAESKPIDEPFEGDEDPRRHRDAPGVPWPVRRGGAILWLYERSLLFAFLVLFFVSFAFHAVGGRMEENEQRASHGLPAQSTADFIASSEFWFQSFQNWQSEFLAMFSIMTLTIYLRYRGSPQSKRVAAPHDATGK
jgi:hypothetical protein